MRHILVRDYAAISGRLATNVFSTSEAVFLSGKTEEYGFG